MTTRSQKKNVPIQQVLAVLMDDNAVFPPMYLHHFSDLEGQDLEAVRSIWPQVSARRRFTLLEDLEDLVEADTLVSFDNLARLALQDPDPRVRTVAIRLLWEADDIRLATQFMQMLMDDPSADVRAAAATALGQYVYQGELEEIPAEIAHQVEDKLLEVINSQDEILVRRRALEAMGFSGREEVPPLIRQAYESADTDWVSTALFAMGRSADTAWSADVLRMLRSPKANIQLEAVRAAGELELDKSRRILLDLLEEEAQDSDIRAAVIWSLSQIGGEEVRETLEELLEDNEDDEEIEILEDALDNLSFTEDVGLYGLFDFNQLGEPNEEIENIEDYISSIENEEPEVDQSGDSPISGATSAGKTSNKDTGSKRKRHGKSK